MRMQMSNKMYLWDSFGGRATAAGREGGGKYNIISSPGSAPTLLVIRLSVERERAMEKLGSERRANLKAN